MKKMEQTWIGHGKKECLEAIRQANRWIHNKRPDKFYDYKYARRSMRCSIMEHNMESWQNDSNCRICDFIDKLYEQIKEMNEEDSYYINVSFIKGFWF